MSKRERKTMRTKIVIILSIALFIGGCACKPTDPEELKIYEENNDPLEPMNRSIFKFNMLADEYVLNPVVKGYRQITPPSVREGIINFIANLEQPLFFVNAALEADGEAMWTVLKRFTVNTTLGFFGIFDAASELGISRASRSFGDTFAVWGFKDGGPYLVLPFIGASNVRDTTGLALTWVADPVSLIADDKWIEFTKWTLAGLALYDSNLELLESIYQKSMDPYAAMRSMWQQNRRKEIARLTGDDKIVEKHDYEFDFPDEEEE